CCFRRQESTSGVGLSVMDPALLELMRSGKPEDEVAVLLRLDHGVVPRGARVVSRFGRIATARIVRSTIPSVRAAAGVRSMKAPRIYWRDWVPTAATEAEDSELRPGD